MAATVSLCGTLCVLYMLIADTHCDVLIPRSAVQLRQKSDETELLGDGEFYIQQPPVGGVSGSVGFDVVSRSYLDSATGHLLITGDSFPYNGQVTQIEFYAGSHSNPQLAIGLYQNNGGGSFTLLKQYVITGITAGKNTFTPPTSDPLSVSPGQHAGFVFTNHGVIEFDAVAEVNYHMSSVTTTPVGGAVSTSTLDGKREYSFKAFFQSDSDVYSLASASHPGHFLGHDGAGSEVSLSDDVTNVHTFRFSIHANSDGSLWFQPDSHPTTRIVRVGLTYTIQEGSGATFENDGSFFPVDANAVRGRHFVRAGGVRMTTGVLTTTTARNHMMCGRECNKDPACAGYNFAGPVSSGCELLALVPACPSADLTSQPGAWDLYTIPVTACLLP